MAFLTAHEMRRNTVSTRSRIPRPTRVIREESLPKIDEIRQKLILAEQDRSFSLHIPVMYLNRRGLYTPILDLRFDSGNARVGLGLVDLVEAVLLLIS